MKPSALNRFRIASALTLLSLTVSSLPAAIITLQQGTDGYAGTEDNSLVQESPTATQGGRTTILAGFTNANNKRRVGLLRFNVSGMAGTYSAVNSISLNIKISASASQSAQSFGAFLEQPVNADWVEGTLSSVVEAGSSCWANKIYNTGSWAGGANGARTASDVYGSVASVAMTAAGYPAGSTATWNFNPSSLASPVNTLKGVLDLWVNHADNAGVAIDPATTTLTTQYQFHSSEATLAADRPILTINATGTVDWALAGSGTWDAATANWKMGTLVPKVLYGNGDTVNFANPLGGTVTIGGGGVLPAAIQVSAVTGAYTLTGGAIGGTAAVTKSGNGNLVLDGIHTYSGATTVNAGKLAGVVGGSCADSAVTVAATAGNSATLGVSVTDPTKQWTCGSLTVNNAGTASDLEIDFGAQVPSVTTAPLSVTGGVTFATTPGIKIAGSNLAVTTGNGLPLMTWGSGAAPTTATLALPPGVNGNLFYPGSGNTLYLQITSVSYPVTWTGATDGNWDTTTSNWAGASSLYTDSTPVIFDDTATGSTTVTNLLSPSALPAAVIVNNTSKDYTIGGNPIAGTAPLTKTGSGKLTLTGTHSFSGGTTVSGGTLQLGDGTALNGAVAGDITDNAAVDFANPNAQTYSGVISGSGALVKSAAGVLTLNNTHYYLGGTTVSAGTLRLGDGTTTNGVVTGAITDNAVLEFANPNAQTRSEVISGSGSLVKSAAGTLTLTNTHTYNGGTTVSGGTLRLGDGSSANGVVAGNITNNAVVEVANPIALTYSGAISGSGSLAKSAAGTLTLTNAHTHAGGTTVSGGRLKLGDGTALNGSVAGDITNNAVLEFANALDQTYSGAISGTGSLVKTAAGTLTLDAVQTYSGGTSIGGGFLKLSGGNNRLPIGSNLGFIGAGTLTLDGVDQSFPAVNVSDNANGKVSGTGTLTLSGQPFQLGSTINNKTQELDLSGLSAFVYNSAASAFTVSGLDNTSGTSNNTTGILTLAAANTLTAASFYVGHFLGNSLGSGKDIGTVKLGTTNVIHADSFGIGDISHNQGTLEFQALTNPSLLIRGTAGGSSRANMVVGQNPGGTHGTGGVVDLYTNVTGTSTLDAMIGTLLIGHNNRGSSAGTTLDATGKFIMGGGFIDATSITVAADTVGTATSGGACTAQGTFTLNSGTVKVASLILGDKKSSGNDALTSTFNLDFGGTLAAQTIQAGSFGGGTPVIRNFNWLEGTIKTYDAASDLTIGAGITFTLEAVDGVRAFDIGTGRSASVAAVMDGAGDLTKTGGGALTLSGSNPCYGATSIDSGSLVLSGTMPDSDITVKSAASFQVVNAGDTLKSLTLESGTSFAAPIDPTGTDHLQITEVLYLSGGTVTVKPTFSAPPALGTFNIAIATGNISGTATLVPDFSVNGPTRVDGTVQLSGLDTLEATVTSLGANLIWNNHAATGVWNLDTDANFLNGAANDVFKTYDHVVFGPSTPTGTVTLAGSLMPSSVKVDTSNNITFAGAGSLTSFSSLDKDGLGTLTIETLNTNTGLITVTAGTLAAATNTALGSGEVTLGTAASGSDPITLMLDSRADLANPITVSADGGIATLAASDTGSGTTNPASFTGTITLDRATTFRNDIVGDRLLFTGKITGTPGTLTISGGQNITLQGTTSDFTGILSVADTGTVLQAGNNTTAQVIPNAVTVDLASGTFLKLYGPSVEEIAGLTGTGKVVRHESATTAQSLAVGSGDATSVFDGQIANNLAGTGTIALIKNGTGTFTLTNTNTYTGNTTISDGTVLVNGSITSNVIANSDTTLGGTGTVAAITANGTSKISPATGTTIGTLSTTAGVLFGTTTEYVVQINSNGTPVADRLAVTGNLVLSSGAKLTLTDLGSTTLSATTRLILATYSGTLTGTFKDGSGTTIAEGADVTIGSNTYKIKYADPEGAGKAITLNKAGTGGYSSWATTNGVGTADADHDGDGVKNGVEYVLGTDPKAATTTGIMPTVTATEFKFTFTRSDASETPDTAVWIETSNDLVNWTGDGSPHAVGTTSSGNVTIVENPADPGVDPGTDTVTLTVPRNTAAKFARLKVIVTP